MQQTELQNMAICRNCVHFKLKGCFYICGVAAAKVKEKLTPLMELLREWDDTCENFEKNVAEPT